MFNKIDTKSPFRRNSMYERFEPDCTKANLFVGISVNDSSSRLIPYGERYDGHARCPFSEKELNDYIEEVLDKY